jgi:cell division protein FtsQ
MQHLWRKRYKTVTWITVSAISLVLLIAAVQHSNNKVCKGINVEINGSENNFFVDRREVLNILTASSAIIDERIADIDLRVLEDRLKKYKCIANAELFFDTEEVLQVVVEEEEPVARIFTVGGSSFYIDSTCQRLPLSNRLSARVPMFTNFPSEKARLSRPDSALMVSIKDLAMFIRQDEFWKAQVAQIDITHGGFLIVPTVGNHIVSIGNSENLSDKFDRLFSFYKQVWTKVGFENYEKIDVQFKGQVVATRRGTSARAIDSLKAKEAVTKLIVQSKHPALASEDSSRVETNKAITPPRIGEEKKETLNTKQKLSVEHPKTTKKPPMKTAVTTKPSVTTQELEKGAAEIKVPKAIMKKSAT